MIKGAKALFLLVFFQGINFIAPSDKQGQVREIKIKICKPPFVPATSYTCILMSILYFTAFVDPTVSIKFKQSDCEELLREILRPILSSKEISQKLKDAKINIDGDPIVVGQKLFDLPDDPKQEVASAKNLLCTAICGQAMFLLGFENKFLYGQPKHPLIDVCRKTFVEHCEDIHFYLKNDHWSSDNGKNEIANLKKKICKVIGNPGGKFYLFYWDQYFNSEIAHAVLLVLSKKASGTLEISLYDDLYQNKWKQWLFFSSQSTYFSSKRMQAIIQTIGQLLS